MIGIDVVPVERLRALLERSKGIEGRLFTERERAYCSERSDPVRHLAGTLAAKEAVIKALRLGPLVAYARRIEVRRDGDGVPSATVAGHPQQRAALSISHDGGMAVAVAVASPEGRASSNRHVGWVGERASDEEDGSPAFSRSATDLRLNPQLVSYMNPIRPRVSEASLSALAPALSLTYGTDFP